jgi:hypothetical protein
MTKKDGTAGGVLAKLGRHIRVFLIAALFGLGAYAIAVILRLASLIFG